MAWCWATVPFSGWPLLFRYKIPRNGNKVFFVSHIRTGLGVIVWSCVHTIYTFILCCWSSPTAVSKWYCLKGSWKCEFTHHCSLKIRLTCIVSNINSLPKSASIACIWSQAARAWMYEEARMKHPMIKDETITAIETILAICTAFDERIL